MTIFVTIIHVIVCLALILIVLLQTGKGADMGAAFGGGGSQALFGSSGASTFLSKATTIVAVLFMITCFYLAYQSTQKNSSSIMKQTVPPVTVPAANTAVDKTTDKATEAVPKATDAVQEKAAGESSSTPGNTTSTPPEPAPEKSE